MERLSDFIPTKRVKRCALSQNEKIIILNVYNALNYQYPTNTITDTVTNCSKMTGIGISTIYRLIKDTQNGQDEMAASRQITVLRLPPYHCELNPIELVWAQVKGDVARNNTSFKLSDVKILLENFVGKFLGTSNCK
ncbi:hypothetical protein NQ315_003288 [Exocentrus adspersus]|uniref:Tc1-like transposase DDE domain-containing protein n=1 Tax=Exocentrus adspersus TaxID=1586481 RepID=A0AAV8VAP6_9CUCU|nr:hypothetical protein NQ315_003288 [Exocentrus adspersus]